MDVVMREEIVHMQTGEAAPSSIDCAWRMGQRVRSRSGPLCALLISGWLLVACGAPAPVRLVVAPAAIALPAQTLAAIEADDPTALVFAERNGASARDLTSLALLWDADARLVEARGGPGPADDYTWQGRDAILNRYAVAVFPNPPPPLADAPDLRATIDGDSATLENGVDAWQFVRSDGRWWIKELVIGKP